MMPRVKILSADHIGWGTYRDRVIKAASLADKYHIDIEPFRQPTTFKYLGRTPRYHDDLPYSLPICSELQKYLFLGLLRPTKVNGFDVAIGIESHVAAALLQSARRQLPVIQILDATLRNFREDFGILGISDTDIEIERNIYHRYSHTIAMSKFVADRLVHDYGLDREKVSVVPPPSFDVLSAPCSLRKTGNCRLRLAFIGGDFCRKGGRDVLEWHRTHWADFADLTIVTGDRYADRTFPSTTWYTGVGPEFIAKHVLPEIDLLLLPTLRDCSSFVTVEAAAFGVPTIATRVGGIEDLIDDCQTGFLLEISERQRTISLVSFINQNRHILAKMSRNCREKFEKVFELNVVFSQILSIAKSTRNRW